MESLPFLPAAVARWAAEDPESPFLFWRDGWLWRWWSWRQVAALVDDWAAALRGARTPRGEVALPPGSRAAFAGDLYPTSIFLDLAAQAAGLTSVPVTLAGRPAPGRPPAADAPLGAPRAGDGDGEAPSRGRLHAELQALGAPPCDVWLEVFASALHWWPSIVPDDAAIAPGRAAGGADRGQPAGDGAGMLVQEATGWRWAEPSDLRRVAGEIGQTIADTPDGPDAGREIVVAGWPLADPAARSLLAWATMAGAAVVLEGDAAGRIGTLAWVRPTVACGGAEELAALRRRVEAAAPRRPRRPRRWPRTSPRLPFGRLRLVLQSGSPPAARTAEGLPADSEIGGALAACGDPDFWLRQGVRLAPLPALATSPASSCSVEPAGGASVDPAG